MNDAATSWTEREIAQQPEVWPLVAEICRKAQPRLQPMLAPLLADPALRIVLTGAGTSSFIGTCLAPALAGQLQRRVDAVATTDLVAGPQLNLQRPVPTLLVSFARSGNSPESVAAVDLANRMLDRVVHLVITCNAEGALARRAATLGNAATLVLPEATNDRGFAMTSSFSSMLLMAALVFGALGPDAVPRLARACAAALPRIDECARQLVARNFERVVFLGSNALRGLAAEAALKLLELADGRTLAMSESVLGFRHGPKTVINDRTLVVVFRSNDGYTRAYDRDLLEELRRDGRAGALLAVGAEGDGPDGVERLEFAGVEDASDLEMALLDVVFAQMLAFRQSLALGLSPDRPNVTGVVNRVVQGVTIHPWPEDRADVPGR
ncbi:MAG: SIS domain-containing protein [Steroidobacteraceae bacterium]